MSASIEDLTANSAKLTAEIGKLETELGLVSRMPTKEALQLEEAVKQMKIDMREIWRTHEDMAMEYLGGFDEFLRDMLIKAASTGGYDPAANPQPEGRIRLLFEKTRHQNQHTDTHDFAPKHERTVRIRSPTSRFTDAAVTS